MSQKTGKATGADDVITDLRSLADPAAVAGMRRYGISSEGTLGVSVYELRRIAKRLGTDHGLALALWQSGIHEARTLASMVDDPSMVTEGQMEEWVRGFDSWDVCDQVCSNLFDKTPFAATKSLEWCGRSEEFVKRAGFAMIAAMAVQDKKADDDLFIGFLKVIARESGDDRNFVKKAVNWALRNIGKRNLRLNREAIRTARAIGRIDSRSARWISADALRELTSEEKQNRLRNGARRLRKTSKDRK